jgi:hypothetical protein
VTRIVRGKPGEHVEVMIVNRKCDDLDVVTLE